MGFSPTPTVSWRNCSSESEALAIGSPSCCLPQVFGSGMRLLVVRFPGIRCWTTLSRNSDQARARVDLAQAKQVVVHFGLAGAAILEEGTLKRLIFLPEELEGVWQDARPGRSFGAGSVLSCDTRTGILWILRAIRSSSRSLKRSPRNAGAPRRGWFGVEPQNRLCLWRIELRTNG